MLDIGVIGGVRLDSCAGVAAAASDGAYAAFSQGSCITVAHVDGLQEGHRPIQLASSLQRSAVTSLAITQGRLGTKHSGTLLVSGSMDALLAWRLESAYAAAAERQKAPAPLLLADQPGLVEAAAADADIGLLAAGLGSSIGVWCVESGEQVFTLAGHKGAVTALCFSGHAAAQLVSASEDRTFKVWDLDQGVLLHQSAVLCAATPTCLAVEPTFPRLAVGASDGRVLFYDLSALPSARHLHVMDVAQRLTKLAASATAEQQRRQPDSGSGRLQPRVITSTPARQQQVQATAAGALHAASGDQGIGAAGSSVCSPGAVLALTYALLAPDEAGQEEEGEESDGRDDDVSACGWDREGSRSAQRAQALLGRAPQLLVGMRAGLAVVNPHSYELTQAAFFGQGLAAPSGGTSPTGSGASQQQSWQRLECLGMAGAFGFATSADQSHIVCCVAGALSSQAAVLGLAPLPTEQQTAGLDEARAPACSSQAEGADQGGGPPAPLSVFQSQALPDTSLLKAALFPQDSASSSSSSSTSSRARAGALPKPGGAGSSSSSSSRGVRPAAKGKSAAGGVANKPVTFHRTIKSSGYGFVQPSITLGKAKPAAVKVTKPVARVSLGQQAAEQRLYPQDSGPLTSRQLSNALPGNAPVHNGAVFHIAFSGDGRRLLTGSADRTARSQLLPVSRFKGEGTDFLGHNGPINSACWSHDGSMVLTSSVDRTAQLWHAAQAVPLLQFTRQRRSAAATPRSSGATPGFQPPASTAPPNPEFVAEVTAARFAYLDQLVVLASGSKLHTYQYKLSESILDDIERLRSCKTYRLVGSCSSASQAITSASCINGFLSTLVVCTGSNRGVEIFDLATMQLARSIPGAHTRAVHTIVQPAASPFAPHAKDAYELFATAAPDHSIKLWDVRVERCVRCFTGHKNAQIRAGIAFSPCMRFLASGSEDQCAYVFDLASGQLAAKTPRMGDAVASVAFNPLHPQLAVGCMDGRVHYFSDAV